MGTLDLIPAQVALPCPNRGDPCHLARTGLGKDRRADAEDGLAGHSTTGRFCGRGGGRVDTSPGGGPGRASVQCGGSFKGGPKSPTSRTARPKAPKATRLAKDAVA